MTLTGLNSLRDIHRFVTNQSLDQISDHDILQRFVATNDESAFAILLRRHGPMVLGLCRRLLRHEQDAEDAFQATFLTLARRASTVRQTDAGGFLYRVAYHLALRARGNAARRRECERQSESAARTDRSSDLTWREIRIVVDEELQHLPAEARSAVVLCYLEGRTQEQAAKQLGWSKATLRRRLERGRELLRARLMARGLAPAVAFTATLFAEESTAAIVPAQLMTTTLRSVVAPSNLSPAVATLLIAGVPASPVGKAKLASMALLTLTLLSGLGLWACLAVSAQPPPKPAIAADSGTPATNGDSDQLNVTGRVLGPDTKPIVGARLYSTRWLEQKPQSPEEFIQVQCATSDAAGRFKFKLPRKGFRPDRPNPLIARADGFGLAWSDLPMKEQSADVTLQLVKDTVIHGRLITTEGKPSVGTTVRVRGILAFDRLDDFLRLYQRENRHYDEGTGARHLTFPPNNVLAVTDKDGRFEIRGVGSERLAGIEVTGPAVEPATILVVTRPDFDATTYRQGFLRREKDLQIFGPSFDYVVLRATPATTVIEGIVREAETGKPVSGATVKGGGVVSVTDADGRYRLNGLRDIPPGAMLQVVAPDKLPLIGRAALLSMSSGQKNQRVDVDLPRGAVIVGRVYDKSTGKGVAGCSVRFSPLPENKAGIGNGLTPYTQTDLEGRFRLVTVKGLGVLLAQVPGTLLKIEGVPVYPYKPAEFDAADRTRVKMSNDVAHYHSFLTAYGAEPLEQSSACKVIDAKATGTTVTCDLALDPGKTLTVNLQDPDGKPLEGAVVAGLSAQTLRTVPLRTATAKIYALDPSHPRAVIFLHSERKLAMTVVLRGDEKEPLTVRLQPTATITGRALTEDGQPLAGAEVSPRYLTLSGQQLSKSQGRYPPTKTDKDGRFRLEGVVPGQVLVLAFQKGWQILVPKNRQEFNASESGITLDVHDVPTKKQGS